MLILKLYMLYISYIRYILETKLFTINVFIDFTKLTTKHKYIFYIVYFNIVFMCIGFFGTQLIYLYINISI